jgi:hypothetical protein
MWLVLFLVSCVRETLCAMFRERCRLRAFENRMLGRIFKPNSDEVTGGWRTFHNEELHNLYCSPILLEL